MTPPSTMAPPTADQISHFTQQNTSGFNYKLPDGTVINTTAPNPQFAATVNVADILQGRSSSPINPELLAFAKTQLGNQTTAYDPTTSVVTSAAAKAGGAPDKPAPNANPNMAWQEGATPAPQPTSEISTHLPGGSATTLNDYFTAKGQALPPVATRAQTFQQMGLGSSKEYTGSAQQNTELLEKLQLNDHATSTFGSSAAKSAAGQTPQQQANNGTQAGASLAAALSGGDATTTLDNYKTYLSSALGAAADKVAGDQSAINDFFTNGYKSADQILSEEMDRQGVGTANSGLAELDKEIQTQSDRLAKLPDDIKTTLQDVGVSQAQLDRLTAKEVKPETDALTALMKERTATASEIDKATTFAKQFADTRVAAQAARLSYLEWQTTSDKGDYAKLDADVKAQMTSAISDQKSILTTAMTAAKNGASQETIDSILNSSSAAEAIQNAGSSLVTPKKTTASNTPAGQQASDIKSAGQYLELGASDKGYNGRGPDGFVDPNLYVALYNAAGQQYGSAGQAAFLKSYPAGKNINPAALAEGILPQAIYNEVFAAQKVKKVTSIQ